LAQALVGKPCPLEHIAAEHERVLLRRPRGALVGTTACRLK